jgi:hypothetical protein
MELNIYRLPDDTIHISRFGDEVAGVMKLNAVSQTFAMFGHGLLFLQFQLETPVVLLPEQT